MEVWKRSVGIIVVAAIMGLSASVDAVEFEARSLTGIGPVSIFIIHPS